MTRIYLMWRMVRILNENAVIWSDQIRRQELRMSFLSEGLEKEYKKEHFDLMLEGALSIKMVHSSDGRLKVRRKSLVNAYFYKHHKVFKTTDLFDEDDLKKSKEARWEWSKVNSIVDSCINRDAPFIKKDTLDPGLIYVTEHGEDFSSRVGLLKEWIKFLGPIWITVGASAALFFSHFDKVVGAIKWLSGKFFT